MAYPFSRQQPGSVRPKTRSAQRWGRFDRRPRIAGGASSVGAAGERHKSAAESIPKVLFESLEPRYLLSADLMPFMVDMAVDGQDLTLKLDLDSSLLRVLDNQNGGSVVAEPVVLNHQILHSGRELLYRQYTEF